MTISEAINELFKFFLDEDCFEIGRDFNKVILISEKEEEHRAILLAALEQLIEQEILRSKLSKGKRYYILTNKLQSYEQTVTIGGACALLIGREINEMCESLGDVRDYCDYTKISERDIVNLVNVIQIYKNQEENKNETY